MSGLRKEIVKVATFNANSIRSRLSIVLDWLKKHEPDVLAVQETKVQDAEFPLAAFKDAGWNVSFVGQKSYNGVALISKEPLQDVRTHLVSAGEEARFISTDLSGVRIINTYIPQGASLDSPKYQKKLQFFSDLKNYFQKHIARDSKALWVGDFNVAPTEMDLSNPKANSDHVCFHIDVRNALKDAMGDVWTDLFRLKEPGPGHYTFWDYRQPTAFERNIGWRVDHIMGTLPMAERLEKIWIDKGPRGMEKPSDHTFLIAEFKGI